MWRSILLRDITSGYWAIKAQYAASFQGNIDSLFAGGQFIDKLDLPEPVMQAASVAYFDPENNNGFSKAESGSTAVVNVVGPMLRYGGMCTTGTETRAAILRAAIASPNISSILLNIDSPGGGTSSVFPLVDAMQASTKPIVAYVNNAAFSAGYYIASYANVILANNPLSEVGSIGVMAMLVDDTEEMAKAGRKRIYIYPPENPDKNSTYHQALEGNLQPMIETSLRPWAQQFQQVVRTNRGTRLRADTPGLLTGGEFYAKDAIVNGLIDGIATFEEAVEYANRLSQINNISLQ